MQPSGPIPADLMIVGEAPGEEEIRLGQPFMGASGQELDRMLADAGLSRGQCLVTNVARERPLGNDIGQFIALTKKEITPLHKPFRDKMVLPPILRGIELLRMELELGKPKVIIACGNLSMWVLTGKWGITDWRGSRLTSDLTPAIIVPTYHPEAILRQWSWRFATILDLKRVRRLLSGEQQPRRYDFVLPTLFAEVHSLLSQWLVSPEQLTLSVDLETRLGHIACIGLADSATHAICIPFLINRAPWHFWSHEEEAAIIMLLSQLLTKCNCIGQNFLYDCQYIWRHWHFIPRTEL